MSDHPHRCPTCVRLSQALLQMLAGREELPARAEVCAAAGVDPAAFGRHFPSLAACLSAATERQARRTGSQLTLDAYANPDPQAALVGSLCALVTDTADEACCARVWLLARDTRDPAALVSCTRAQRRIAHSLAHAHGRGAGTDWAEIVVGALLWAVHGGTSRPRPALTPAERRSVVERVLAIAVGRTALAA